ncbi:MAG: response regulator [Burkholderiales bacterium]
MTETANAPIYIVDDDDDVRDSLATLLRAAGRKVETYSSAESFVEQRGDASDGCLVLDLRMSGMSGLELQEVLCERQSSLPILFLTGHGDVPSAVRAIKRGASDFIEKPVDDRELLRAIDNALERGTRPPLPAIVGTLTRREREVLDLILSGHQTRAIAEKLFISVKTVEFHRSRIHVKLKVSSMAELFMLCLGNARPPPARPEPTCCPFPKSGVNPSRRFVTPLVTIRGHEGGSRC